MNDKKLFIIYGGGRDIYNTYSVIDGTRWDGLLIENYYFDMPSSEYSDEDVAEKILEILDNYVNVYDVYDECDDTEVVEINRNTCEILFNKLIKIKKSDDHFRYYHYREECSYYFGVDEKLKDIYGLNVYKYYDVIINYIN